MRKVGIMLWVALVAAAGAADERGEPVAIDAQQLSFDRPHHLAFGDGDVVIHYRDAVVRADRVKVNTATKELWADGHVRLNRDGQEWVAPAAYYNLDTCEFRAERMRGWLFPVFVGGRELSGVGTNYFTARSVTLTPCDYDEPHFRVQATRAEIWPGDRIVLHNVTVRAGDVPVFWLPALIWPLNEDLPVAAVSLGHKSQWGFFVLTSTAWRLNPHLDLKIHVDERTERGPGGGADADYRWETGHGSLRGYYLHDQDPQHDTNADLDIPGNRYRAQWQHKQSLPGDVAVTVNVNRWSDREVLDDFFPSEYALENEPQTVVDATKRGPNYTLSLQARPQVNRWFAEVERLPEAKLAVNRTRLLDTPVFYEGESSAGYYHNHRGDTGDALFTGHAVRADTFHQLVVPQTWGGWLSVVPRAGIRGTYYLDAPETAPHTAEVRRVVYDLGLETSCKVSRTWPDVRNDWLKIDGLRHILQPFANYAWVPQPNVGTNELFQFDTLRTVTLANGETLPVTRYTAVDFPADNTIDAIDRLHVVRFGLRQRLQTRREGKPWDLLDLETWTDYRIERDAGENDFSDWYATLRLRPTNWCRLETTGRYDPHAGMLREWNSGVHVGDGDRWSAGVGTRYLQDDSSLVSTELAVRLTRHWTALWYARVDVNDGTWEEQECRLRQETHDWYIHYGARYRASRTAEDEWTVFLSFTLKAFPGIRLGIN